MKTEYHGDDGLNYSEHNRIERKLDLPVIVLAAVLLAAAVVIFWFIQSNQIP